jgi:hypothetical protein
MAAKAKLAKKERVPVELFSTYNAARADMLQMKLAGEAKLNAFATELQGELDKAVAGMNAAAGAIAKVLNFVPGDTFSSTTGIVTRKAATAK